MKQDIFKESVPSPYDGHPLPARCDFLELNHGDRI
jgi:hypothetical protein